MLPRRLAILSLLALALLPGCGGDGNRELGGGDMGQTSPPAPPALDENGPEAPPQGGNQQENLPEPAERKIIRNGSMSIEVQSVDSADATLARIATAAGGYVASTSRIRSSGNARSGATEIRIPSDHFQTALAQIRSLGNVQSESITATDVTAEFIDLGARLKTQQELEARLLGLLQDRGGKLSDIIEIESKLAQVRATIEELQGRLRFLQRQVSYSTFTVTMMEPGAVGVGSTETFGGKMGRAFSRGIDGLVDVMAILITAVLALLPLAALVAVLYYLVVRPWRRRRNEEKAKQKKGTDESRGA